MIKAKTPILNQKKELLQDQKYFAAQNKIVPIQRITSDLIRPLDEIKLDEILSEKKLVSVIKEKKTTNPFSKFFKKALKYVDTLENFIKSIQDLQLKSIVQKKILLNTEKSDQKIREYQSKRIVKENVEADKEHQEEEIDLSSNPSVGGLIAAALGLGGGMLPGGGGGGGGDEAPEAPGSISGKIIPQSYPITSVWHEVRTRELHPGVDIGTPPGTYIGVNAKSKVITTGSMKEGTGDPGGYGNFISLWVPELNKQLVFGHLSQINVKNGQELSAGSVLGRTGSTGRVTAPHLHFEIHASQAYEGSANNQNSTSYINWLILGEKLKKEATGGIDTSRNIMVGEAGLEFIVPMSQMPLFVKAMVQEKLKSLDPTYICDHKIPKNIGIKPSTGMTNERHADGKIINYSNPNYAIAAKKLKQLFPQAKNYHIAGAIGNFETEAPGLIPTTQQPDGPGYGIAQWTKSQRWSGADSPLYYSALKFGGPGITNSLTKQLEFVHFELTSPKATDNIVDGHKLPSPLQKWLATKNVVDAAFTFMKVYEQPGKPHLDRRKAAAIDLDKNMNMLLGIVPPKPVVKKEPNFIEKLINIIAPPPGQKKASLNNIDASTQSAFSRETQSQFSFENAANTTVAFYKPTVYYSEVS